LASIDQALLASLDLVFAQNREGHFVYVSSITARAFGEQRDRLLGKTFHDLDLPLSVIQQLQTAHRAIIANGQAFTGEVCFPAFYPDQLKDYEYTFSPVPGRDGYIEAAVFIGKDITQRKQAERALQESEKKYRLLFESANDAIFIVECRSRQILNANWSAARRLGYSRRELLNLAIDTIEVPLVPEVYEGIMEELEIEGNIIYEHRYRRKDGTEIPVEINAQLIEYEDRLAIQYFVRDISQRKQAEESLRQQQQQLASIAANFPGAIYRTVVSREGHISLPYVSEGIQETDGYSAEQLMANPHLLMESIHPEDRKDVLNHLKAARKGLQPLDLEYRTCPMEQETRWVRELAHFFRDEDGNVVADGVVLDITDRKQAQLALQRQLEQEQLLRQVTEHIHQSLNLDDTLQLMVEDVRQYLQADRVLILRFNDDQTGDIVVEAVSEAASSIRDWDARASASILAPSLCETTLVVSDVHHSEWCQSYIDRLFYQAQTRAVLTAPIMIQQDGEGAPYPGNSPVVKPWGILIVHHCADARDWQPYEVELLQKLATQAGIGIYQAELYQKLQVELQERRRVEAEIRILNADLEQRVLRRTEQLYQSNLELAEEISERLRIEVALRESNQRYEALASLSPVGIFRTNGNGECIYYNQRCCEILGCAGVDLFPCPTGSQIHPGDRPQVLQTWQHALEQATPYRIECRYLNPNGQTVWTITQGHPEIDDNGQILGFVNTITDITELKRAEQEIRTSQARLRTLIDALPFAVWARDAEERLILQNPIDVQRFGDLLGTAPESLDCKPEIISAYREFHELSQPNRVMEYEMTELYEGEDHHFLRIVTPFPDFDGRQGCLGVVIDITQRKQAELALEKSEALFRSLFETAAVGIALTDPTHTLLRVNEKLCQILGYAEAELRSLTFRDFTHPDDLACCDDMIARLEQKVIRNESVEKRCRRKDGTLIWIQTTLSAVYGTSGEIENYCVIVEDISDRKRAEFALRDSEARFRTIFDNAGFGIVVVEPPHYDFQFSNPAFQSLVGYGTEELAALSFDDLTHPDDVAQEWLLVEACLSGQCDRYQLEKRYLHKDGSTVWVNLMSTIVRDASGEIRFGIGLVEDITTRKLNEEAQRQAEIALQRSEAQQRAILEAIPDILDWVRADGVLVKTIRTNCPSSLIPPGIQPEGQHLSEVLPAEIAQIELAAIERALAKGSLEVLEHSYDRGDRVQYQEVRVVPVTADEVLLMVRDISDRKRAELALQEMKERYELAVTGIGEVLWDWDIVQNRCYMSPRCWEVLGVTTQPQEFYPIEECLEWIHPEDRPWVEQTLQKHLEQRQGFNIEYRMRHQSGDYIWVRNRGQAIWDKTNHPVRMIGTWSDISEFKRLNAALRQSEASYRAIVELQTELVCRSQPDCTLTYANEAYYQYFQLPPDAIPGYNWLYFIPPEEHASIRDYLASLGPEKPTGHHEHQVMTPWGEVRWHAWSDRVLLNEAGQVVEIQSVGRDITERKQLELALAQTQATLNDVLEHVNASIIQMRLRNFDDIAVEFVSAGCEQVFGFSADVLQTHSDMWRLHVEPEDLDQVIIPSWKRLLETQADRAVYRFRHPNGQLRWIEVNAIARYDTIQKHWIITAIETDVTTLFAESSSS